MELEYCYPSQNQKRPKNHWKELRSITLPEVIRKILSKILMNRTEDKTNLAQSKSSYRKSRSTTEIMRARRWIIVKTQIQDTAIFVTGIDMSSAFDTIQREQLINRAKNILSKDEIRILRVLLPETTLEVKAENIQTTTFCLSDLIMPFSI